MKALFNAVVHHSSWFTGICLLIYSFAGLYTGQLHQPEALLAALSGLGLFGVHFKTN